MGSYLVYHSLGLILCCSVLSSVYALVSPSIFSLRFPDEPFAAAGLRGLQGGILGFQEGIQKAEPQLLGPVAPCAGRARAAGLSGCTRWN